MRTLRLITGLGPLDAKTVGRDSLLRGMVLLPLLIALLARWVVPEIFARIATMVQIDLRPAYPVIMGYALLLIAPVILGTAVGFVLLDQRDDQTLAALQVTPLPLPAYLVYRLAAPALVSVIMTVLAFPLAGLGFNSGPVFVAALAAAPLAAVVALALAAFGENKVQGFALMKGANVFFIAPMIAAFIPGNWQWAFGVAPTFWPARLLSAAQAGAPSAWLYLLVGLAYQLLLIVALLRRFGTVIRR